jgi:NAD(P)-dependent dehydrogenase (short-subunit alcohol dehydrogenase family)
MNSNQLKNKVALVTGSSMGIGKAIAWELADNGAKIVLNGRDKERLLRTEQEFLKNGYDATAVPADVRSNEKCEFLVAQTINNCGKLDILVNNAGVSSRGSVEKMATGNIETLIETNYNGAAFMSKYAVPHLKKSKGNIIFINSVGGLRGMPYNSAYTASKLAQAALAEALRIELYDYGIHVGLIYVGFTENDPNKIILDVDGTQIYLPKRNNIRLTKPQSVAKSVVRMISKRSNRVTLTNLGLLADFMVHHFPALSDWILNSNRGKIKEQFTNIGGERVAQNQKLMEAD